MNILVTGGGSFVGINIVRHLAATIQDIHLTVADRHALDAPADQFLAPVADRVRMVQLDVTDRAAVQQVVRTNHITHIVHAAAITPDPERERAYPTPIVDVNLGGAINVLDAAIQSPTVERVLLLSSDGVYGAPAVAVPEPQREDGALQIENLYTITKYSVELLAATRLSAI